MFQADHHKNTEKSIIPTIRSLSIRSLWPWVFDVVIDWSIVLAALVLVALYHSFFVVLLVVLVIGNRQHALAVLGHDGTHYTVHHNQTLNDFISNLFCFWPLLITVDGYRRLHFLHHKNTGNSNDPELMHKKARSPQWDVPMAKSRVALYMLKDLVGYSIPDLIIILTFSAPEKKRHFLPVLVLHSIFVAVCLTFGLWWIPIIWYGSLATTFMMFFRIRLWLEHQGTYETQRISLSPLVAAIIAPHKIWLHWEHHKFPAVPYHKLSQVRKLYASPAPRSLSEHIASLSLSEFLPSGVSRE